MDLLDRIAQKIEVQDDGCWKWTAFKDSRGYGKGRFGPGRSQLAHRAIWQIVVGPVEDGLELDHLCRNPSCVNPDHLEPVTHAENMQRSPIEIVGQRNKTHCPRGHEYTPENIYWANNGTHRICRECTLARERAKRQ